MRLPAASIAKSVLSRGGLRSLPIEVPLQALEGGRARWISAARHCELGISIGDKDYWGRGSGRGAVSLLLDYAFRLRNLRRVWLEDHASNERAIRAYRSCGFVEEGRMREHIWLDGRYLDNVLMGILRDEWRR